MTARATVHGDEGRTSGARTGTTCSCGAVVHMFFVSRWYTPGEVIPLPAPKHWEYICAAGHRQPEQRGLFDEVAA